jgi:hypothetical protein
LSFAPGLRFEDDWTGGDFLGETWASSQAITLKGTSKNSRLSQFVRV